MGPRIVLAGERPQRRTTAQQVLLPYHLVQAARPHADGEGTAWAEGPRRTGAAHGPVIRLILVRRDAE